MPLVVAYYEGLAVEVAAHSLCVLLCSFLILTSQIVFFYDAFLVVPLVLATALLKGVNCCTTFCLSSGQSMEQTFWVPRHSRCTAKESQELEVWGLPFPSALHTRQRRGGGVQEEQYLGLSGSQG